MRCSTEDRRRIVWPSETFLVMVHDPKNNEVHGAKNNERHVCGRRRVGEAAVSYEATKKST
jgi:hypothetical protein